MDGTGTDIDGTNDDFYRFCTEFFIGNEKELLETFNSVQNHLENIFGRLDRMTLDLRRPVHIDGIKVTQVDELISGWDPSANVINDLFSNKVGFIVALNFPYYTLEEKEKLGEN